MTLIGYRSSGRHRGGRDMKQPTLESIEGQVRTFVQQEIAAEAGAAYEVGYERGWMAGWEAAETYALQRRSTEGAAT